MIDAINKRLEMIKRNSSQNDQLEFLIYTEVKEMFEWYQLTPLEKQIYRIDLFRSLRFKGIERSESLLNIINLYSKINECLPFIMSIQYVDSTKLIELCNKEIKFIDREKSMFFEHVTDEEFQLAFSVFFEEEKKLGERLYKETIEKIHELYASFKLAISQDSNPKEL